MLVTKQTNAISSGGSPYEEYTRQSLRRTIIYQHHLTFLYPLPTGQSSQNAGAYKKKGIPIVAVVKYLISLVYTGKSMFQDMRSALPYAQGFKKDTVYRFLNQSHINWQGFLLRVASKIVTELDSLTCDERRSVFVIDDTLFPALHAKKTELVSWIYDHAEKGSNKFKRGFRMLTLGWSDGVSFIPLAFRHLASSDKAKQCCGYKETLDKRSRAYHLRQEAVSKATDVMLKKLKAALKAGIKAKHVLFDSWYSYPVTIIKICALKLHVTARVKNTSKVTYLINGDKKTAKQIFQEHRKRRGRSRYLLSVPIVLVSSEDETTLPSKLVYVRNRQKRKEWIALLSTDVSLTEEEIITLYGKRWDIEVFFKVCKSYLKLTGEFRQLSYDAITAHTTLVMIRYMVLWYNSVEQGTAGLG